MKNHFTNFAKSLIGLPILLVAAFLLNQSFINDESQLPMSVSVCGAEFGQQQMPGIMNKDYVYPTAEQMNYYASKGIKQIALPFRWERIQNGLFGKLDEANLREIENTLRFAEKNKMGVILDMHNYGHYRIMDQDFPIGSNEVSIAAYCDAWRKFAARVRKHTNIVAYQIMAEPHDMGSGVWAKAAQEVILAIREVDSKTPILVDGDGWASAYNWKKFSDNLKHLKDPGNKIVYSAHCYFDADGSGTYVNGYQEKYHHEQIGIEKVKPFIEWLEANNKKGFIGEYGVPNNDRRWVSVMDRFLAYLHHHNIGSNYWAAGAWWKNYPLSIEPIQGKEKPQMQVLSAYLSGKIPIYGDYAIK